MGGRRDGGMDGRTDGGMDGRTITFSKGNIYMYITSSRIETNNAASWQEEDEQEEEEEALIISEEPSRMITRLLLAEFTVLKPTNGPTN